MWVAYKNVIIIRLQICKLICKLDLFRVIWTLSTVLRARGCHALQHVIGWALSCTCIVTSWLQRRRPKHGGLADRWGSTCHVYGRKFAIKIQCQWDKKYVSLKMKTSKFSACKILLEIVTPFPYKLGPPNCTLTKNAFRNCFIRWQGIKCVCVGGGVSFDEKKIRTKMGRG